MLGFLCVTLCLTGIVSKISYKNEKGHVTLNTGTFRYSNMHRHAAANLHIEFEMPGVTDPEMG